MKLSDSSKYSAHNKTQLLGAQTAACYYCMKTFSTQDILEYIKAGDTALCPECGVDAVLADNLGFDLSPEGLFKLNKYWFG